VTEPATPQHVVPLELAITSDVEVGVAVFFFLLPGLLLQDLRLGLLGWHFFRFSHGARHIAGGVVRAGATIERLKLEPVAFLNALTTFLPTFFIPAARKQEHTKIGL
jgi:hypothetical protein